MAESDFETRLTALRLAVQSEPTGAAGDVVARAAAFLSFLLAGADLAAQVTELRATMATPQAVSAAPAVEIADVVNAVPVGP